MRSKATLLGHPVHPMLIVFPLGLLATSLVFDFIYLGTKNGRYADASFWMISAGIIGALLAAVFGTIDWLGIPAQTRAKAIGLWHGIGNVVVVVLFAINWSLRYNGVTTAPTGGAVALSVIAVLLAVVTGWLGGELVDRLGIGVDEGAHANSPNSLSNRSAAEVDTKYTEGASGTVPGRAIPGRGAASTAGTRGDDQRRDIGRPSTADQRQGPSDRDMPV